MVGAAGVAGAAATTSLWLPILARADDGEGGGPTVRAEADPTDRGTRWDRANGKHEDLLHDVDVRFMKGK